MKKFGARVLAAVVTSSMIVTPVVAAPSSDELKQSKEAKQSEVNSLQTQLTELMSKIGKLEEDLIKKGEEITQAEADLQVAQEKEQEQYEAMKKRIKFMYEEGDGSVLESLITAENFTDLVNKAEYVQNVHTYDRNQLEEYIQTKEQVADLKETLEEDQKKMENMQADYEAQETELSTTIESKKSEIADLDSQIQAAAEAAAAEAAERENANRPNNGNTGGGNTGGGTNNPPINNGGGSSGGGTGNTSAAQAIVNAAYSQLGVPYEWGGTTPGVGLDCSGLTQYCHRVAGISIPRTSQAQGGGGKAVTNPQPGDLVCYGGHVGIYIGGGNMIHAPHTGDVVRVASVYGSPWYRRYW